MQCYSPPVWQRTRPSGTSGFERLRQQPLSRTSDQIPWSEHRIGFAGATIAIYYNANVAILEELLNQQIKSEVDLVVCSDKPKTWSKWNRLMSVFLSNGGPLRQKAPTARVLLAYEIWVSISGLGITVPVPDTLVPEFPDLP